MAAILVSLIGLAAAKASGRELHAIRSGSMAPAIETGDLIVSKSVRPTRVALGEVVTFRDPSRHGHLVTHRVVGISPAGDRVSFITKGDANTGVEDWSISAGGSLGLMERRIPVAGYVLYGIARPEARGLLYALVTVVAIVGVVRRILSGRRGAPTVGQPEPA